jgi:hypothetical protein
MNILQLAGMLPRDPQFREWVTSFTEDAETVTTEQAAEFVRIVCGVDSRRQLAEDAGAAESFHTFIRKPYVAWKESI